jgi:hypothetical protein
LLISPTRDLRDKINDKIRESLEQENLITEKIHKFTALRPKDMSKGDYGFVLAYNVKNLIGNIRMESKKTII